MEYKNISSKSTLQPRAKYKNTKMETCLQGLLPGDIKKLKTYITAKIQTFRQNSDFSIIKQYTVLRGRSRTSATSINGDIHYNIKRYQEDGYCYKNSST